MRPFLRWVILAAALLFMSIAALLTMQGVAAQHNTDDASLINVTSLTQLDAIRWDLDGNGTADNPTDSTDPNDANAQTQGDAYAAAFSNVTCPTDGCTGYELTRDLNFSGSKWASGDGVGPYWRSTRLAARLPMVRRSPPFFEGNGHSISNLYIDREDEDGMGLFGNCRSPELRGHTALHVQIRNVDAAQRRCDGRRKRRRAGRISPATGSISNSSVTGSVTGVSVGTGHDTTGGRDVGGLAGSSSVAIRQQLFRRRCDRAGVPDRRAGRAQLGPHHEQPRQRRRIRRGRRGRTWWDGTTTILRSSYATGDVTGTGADDSPVSSIGGLVGTHWYDGSTISNSYATGNVAGTSFVGGLVGLAWGGDIQTSYASGDVTGEHIETTFESDGETLVSVDLERPDRRAGRG